MHPWSRGRAAHERMADGAVMMRCYTAPGAVPPLLELHKRGEVHSP